MERWLLLLAGRADEEVGFVLDPRMSDRCRIFDRRCVDLKVDALLALRDSAS